MKILCIIALLMPMAQQPQGGPVNSYPIVCPQGSHLDQVAAEEAKNAYDAKIAELNQDQEGTIKFMTDKVRTLIWACQSDAACIKATKVQYADDVVFVTNFFLAEKELAKTAYLAALSSCCIPD